MPRLFVRRVLAGRVGGVETNAAPVPVDHESCRDDVPKVLCDDVDRQEIEFSWLVRLAVTAGLDTAAVATFRHPVDGRLNLYAYEVTVGFDHDVVARKVSPRFGNRQTKLAAFAMNCNSAHSPRRLAWLIIFLEFIG